MKHLILIMLFSVMIFAQASAQIPKEQIEIYWEYNEADTAYVTYSHLSYGVDADTSKIDPLQIDVGDFIYPDHNTVFLIDKDGSYIQARLDVHTDTHHRVFYSNKFRLIPGIQQILFEIRELGKP